MSVFRYLRITISWQHDIVHRSTLFPCVNKVGGKQVKMSLVACVEIADRIEQGWDMGWVRGGIRAKIWKG